MPAGSQITIPSTPAAPATFEAGANDAVAVSVSPFTGQQQIQYWGSLPMELSVTFPPIQPAYINDWVAFLRNLQGRRNYFQFGSAFNSTYSSTVGSRYWRLKGNMRKWSVSEMRVCGISLDLIEAL